MLNRLKGIIEGLLVYPKDEGEHGKEFWAVQFTKVMLALTDKGLTREDAYSIVQRNAKKSWKQRRILRPCF